MWLINFFKHLFNRDEEKQAYEQKKNDMLAELDLAKRDAERIRRAKLDVAPTPTQMPTMPKTLPVKVAPDASLDTTQYMDPSSPMGALINEVSKKYGYHPRLLAALVGTESSGNAKAKSWANAYGLTQITPIVMKDLGESTQNMERLYDPRTSLEMTGRALQKFSKRYPSAFNDPVSVYRVWNTGNPNGTFEQNAEARFRRMYAQARSRYGK